MKIILKSRFELKLISYSATTYCDGLSSAWISYKYLMSTSRALTRHNSGCRRHRCTLTASLFPQASAVSESVLSVCLCCCPLLLRAFPSKFHMPALMDILWIGYGAYVRSTLQCQEPAVLTWVKIPYWRVDCSGLENSARLYVQARSTTVTHSLHALIQ